MHSITVVVSHNPQLSETYVMLLSLRDFDAANSEVKEIILNLVVAIVVMIVSIKSLKRRQEECNCCIYSEI